jgi:hypothetical protein
VKMCNATKYFVLTNTVVVCYSKDWPLAQPG